MMHYCHNELIINDILRFFGGIYNIRDMDEEKQRELFSRIKADPNNYILKPMREGGGNNIIGDKLKELIPEEGILPGDLLKNSVIVDKIDSAIHESIVLRNEKISFQNSISEYSIYGIILSDENKIHINKSISFLVRTKNKDDIEGGIMEGAGAIDLPCLLDVNLETNLSNATLPIFPKISAALNLTCAFSSVVASINGSIAASSVTPINDSIASFLIFTSSFWRFSIASVIVKLDIFITSNINILNISIS